MKILYADALKEDYFAAIWYGTAFSLIALGFLVFQLIKLKKSGFDWSRILLSVALVILMFFLSYSTGRTVHEGVHVQYKATITDFNVVHDKGFEIIDRKGDLYTLVKVGE